ncbi:hypothetical protein UFOVP751_42 [uncultured Caudovirales phage]|uniref:Uncharacterized protein n=1 Tax=uncultured Caudovirales phage TaxID=2100421 RepID=A0A6J7XNG6_9CAUD|nr:hypothetical protein UFOVP751_42 [uncultured Caudovirales phage]
MDGTNRHRYTLVTICPLFSGWTNRADLSPICPICPKLEVLTFVTAFILDPDIFTLYPNP